jgi:hypothetical protein
VSAEIFISFASQDHRVAMTLCSALESRGIKCWISSRDILPGENFQVSIVRAIRQAKVMLLVFTANSNNSDEMNKELALASQSKLIVVPLRIEDVTPNEAFAYEFATRQWIDFFADWELAVEQLAQRIQNATKQPAAAFADAPVDEVSQPAVLAPKNPVLSAPKDGGAETKRATAKPRNGKTAPPAAPQETPAILLQPEASTFAGADDDSGTGEEAAVADARPRRTAIYVGVSAAIVIALGVGLAIRGVSGSRAAPAEPRAMVAVSPPVGLQKASAAAAPEVVPAAPSDVTPTPAKPVRHKKATVAKPADSDVPF